MERAKAIIEQALTQSVVLYLKDGQLAYISEQGGFSDSLKLQVQAHKADILDYLASQEAKKQKEKGANKITVVDRSQPLPLSFSQQGLWLVDKLEGGSSHYNLPRVLKLSGLLDIAAATKAFADIVVRHESLRTCFAESADGTPCQVIQSSDAFSVDVVDLSQMENTEQDEAVLAAFNEDSTQCFDLTRDYMLKVKIYRLSPDEHILLVTMHHIVSDGWSFAILITEFSQLYGAYLQGQENPLQPLQVQYADFAHWQRNYLQGEVLEQLLDHWSERLDGLPLVHSLPLDRMRPAVQTFVGDIYTSRINMPLVKNLTRFCQSHHATLFMGLQAAFAVLLARYSNETDIVMGTPIANREMSQVAPLIGFFMNNLVLRSDLSGNPTFESLLAQSKAMLLDAYANQQVPFDQLIEKLQPKRSSSHSPLFQVMLILQNNEEGELDLPGLSLSHVELMASMPKYDLTLSINEQQQLSLDWEYNSDLFDGDTIHAMAEHFERLLHALVNAPYESVFQVDMLSATERNLQMKVWNDNCTDYPQERCIHQWFERQVDLNPDAIAIECGAQQLNYGELNARANQLAHYLCEQRQVTPDTMVGICLERSIEMMVAVMAVLKAGGAYVPLAMDFPAARLSYMMQDAGLETVLTRTQWLEGSMIGKDQAVCVDDPEIQRLLLQYPTTNVDNARLESGHLAYMIYTSGSTGQPKGVMVPHQSVSNYLEYATTHYLTDAMSGSVVSSPLYFDATVTTLFTPLCAGKSVVLLEDDDAVFATLGGYLLDDTPRMFKITPAHLTALRYQLMDDSQCKSDHCVVVGGEQLTVETLLDWKSRLLPNTTFINEYGPTETTVGCSVYRVETIEDLDDCSHSVAIGRPISNTQLYVLNQGQMVTIGAIGELYIGGAGLTWGYHNNAEMTCEKFVSHSFENDEELLLYRTGDLVRYLPNGNLSFLSRVDDQVKIRGFRIELGEIVHALNALPAISQAVVMVKTGEDNDKFLVAYVTIVPDFDDSVSQHKRINSLRLGLAENLPDYMVPSKWVVLDNMPLTLNGKIDTKALPEPDVSVQQAQYVAPHTPTQKALCGIWQQLLGVERVGIMDNFFELGGHSLMIMRLVALVESTFSVGITARMMFEFADLQSLAAYLDVVKVNDSRLADSGNEDDSDPAFRDTFEL